MLYDERVVPEKAEPGTLAFHLRRYQWAQEFSHNKVVLDVGCGVGYGASLLAETAKWVVGVDYDWDAINYARHHYKKRNLNYAVMDCRWLGFPDSRFDLVISFEVYEHLPKNSDEMFLGEVKRLLRPGGYFLLSTPNAETWGIYWRQSKQQYKFHVNEVDVKKLRQILWQFFPSVTILGMRQQGNSLYEFLRGLDIFNLRLRLLPLWRRERLREFMGVKGATELTPEDVIISPRQLRQAHSYIAVCRC